MARTGKEPYALLRAELPHGSEYAHLQLEFCGLFRETSDAPRFLLTAQIGRLYCSSTDKPLEPYAVRYGIQSGYGLVGLEFVSAAKRALTRIERQLDADRDAGIDVGGFGGRALSILSALRMRRLFVVRRLNDGYQFARNEQGCEGDYPDLPLVACYRQNEDKVLEEIRGLLGQIGASLR